MTFRAVLLHRLILAITFIELIVSGAAFNNVSPLTPLQTFSYCHKSAIAASSNKNNGHEHDVKEQPELSSKKLSSRRRQLLSAAMGIYSSSSLSTMITSPCPCGCRLYRLPPADALAEIKSPSSNLVQSYDRPRNLGADVFFSWNMATGMEGYEADVRPYKTKLFQTLFDSLAKIQYSGSDGNTSEDYVPVVVEIGMGTFPNAPYYAQAMKSSGLKGLDIIGVDPNDSMSQYAQETVEKSGLLSSSRNVSLRTVHGVAEALPFENHSIDAIVGTLTLCSVLDPDQSLSEIRRVLKPNQGKFLFFEHVLSETDVELAKRQKLLSPLQTFMADGCHLNRRTGTSIQNAGFDGGVKVEYLDLDGYGLISPTIFGIASV